MLAKKEIFPFMSLPPELRKMILVYSFVPGSRVRWRGYADVPVLYHPKSWLYPRISFPMLGLSRDLRVEALGLFYDTVSLLFYDLDSLMELLDPLSRPAICIYRFTKEIVVRYEGEEISEAIEIVKQCQALKRITLQMTNASMTNLWSRLPRNTRYLLERFPEKNIATYDFNEAGMKQLFSFRDPRWKVHVEVKVDKGNWLSESEQLGLRKLLAYHFPPPEDDSYDEISKKFVL